MNTKDLSPAFFTSLAAIFIAALMIGTSSTVLTVLGWLILLVALGLNVFASLVSLQRAKGGPLPAIISEDHHVASDRHETQREEKRGEEESAEHRPYESEDDTEAHPLVSSRAVSAEESEEKIFRTRAPRPRNR